MTEEMPVLVNVFRALVYLCPKCDDINIVPLVAIESSDPDEIGECRGFALEGDGVKCGGCGFEGVIHPDW